MPETYTPEQRAAILNYRRMRQNDTRERVGSGMVDVGRVAHYQDPLGLYKSPTADNLTEEQKAKLAAQYSDILAKLAAAEREAQSSDQDYASKMVIARNGILEAMIKASADLGVADKQVAIAKINEMSQIAEAATKQYEGAQSALSLSPEGQAMVTDVQKQVMSTGVLNATATLQTINKHIGQLAKTNPAQIPAYIANLESAFKATGRPEYRDFSVEDMLTKMNPRDPGQVTLVNQIAGTIAAGDAAAQTQAQLYDQGFQRAMQAETDLRKFNGGMPEPLRSMVNDVSRTLRVEPTRDLSPQVMAPPPTADVDAKRAYVERASGGQQTLNDQGYVVNASTAPGAAPGPAGSYEGFIQVYPGVRTDGAASSGGMAPTGGGYSRSGPTADTIQSIRKLRTDIEARIAGLDKRNPDPLTAAKMAAAEARGGVTAYRDPRFAERAAERTALAEQRGLRRQDRAERDVAVLTGQEAAGGLERAGAALRTGFRGLRQMAARPEMPAVPAASPGQAPDEQAPMLSSAGEPPMPPTPDRRGEVDVFFQGAKRALMNNDPDVARNQIRQMVGAAGDPGQLRAAAKLYEAMGDKAMAADTEDKADAMELALTTAQRDIPRPDDGRSWNPALRMRQPTPRETARAQYALETQPEIPSIEDWQPDVPGRTNTTPQAGRDYKPVEAGHTLSDRTGKNPLESVYSMGDFGATENANRMTNPPDRVPFQRAEPPRPGFSMRPAATPVQQGMESTGGDSSTGEKPASQQDVGQALESFGQSMQGQSKAKPAQRREPIEFGPTDAAAWRQFIKPASELLGQPDAEQPPAENVPEDPGLSLRRRQRKMVDGAVSR